MKLFSNVKFYTDWALLTAILSASSYFAYWVVAENDDDQVHDVLVEYGKHILHGEREWAVELLDNTLSAKADEPLDPIWLQLVRTKSNGYERLGYYMRILAGDPDREATYSEISNFIELAPEAFNEDVKERYLSDMKALPGIRNIFLEKYGLLLEVDAESL